MNKNLEKKLELMVKIATTCENNTSCDGCSCKEQCRNCFRGEQPRFILETLENLKIEE